jgi:hypothetical protein
MRVFDYAFYSLYNLYLEKDCDIVFTTATECGVYWSGLFKKKDNVHFYREVPGGRKNRSKYIEKAQKYYANNYN